MRYFLFLGYFRLSRGTNGGQMGDKKSENQQILKLKIKNQQKWTKSM